MFLRFYSIPRNPPVRSIVSTCPGISIPVQSSVSNPVIKKNMAVRPLMISAFATQPTFLDSSYSAYTRSFRHFSSSLFSAVTCEANSISFRTTFPGTFSVIQSSSPANLASQSKSPLSSGSSGLSGLRFGSSDVDSSVEAREVLLRDTARLLRMDMGDTTHAPAVCSEHKARTVNILARIMMYVLRRRERCILLSLLLRDRLKVARVVTDRW